MRDDAKRRFAELTKFAAPALAIVTLVYCLNSMMTFVDIIFRSGVVYLAVSILGLAVDRILSQMHQVQPGKSELIDKSLPTDLSPMGEIDR